MNKDFNNKIYKLLIKTKKNIMKDTDISQIFGQNISKINYIINYDNISICIHIISDINKLNSDLEQYISNVHNISYIIKKKCVGLIISNINIPDVIFQLIDYENNKNFNQFVLLNDISYVELMKKILNYFYSNGIWMYDGEDCIMIY